MAHNLLQFLRFGIIISDSLFTRIVVQSFCFVSSLTPHVRHQTQIEFNQERASVPSDGACRCCGQGHGCCADPHPPSQWMLPCHPSLHYFKMILLLCWCCLLVLQRKLLLRGRLCCGRLRGGKLSVWLLLLLQQRLSVKLLPNRDSGCGGHQNRDYLCGCSLQFFSCKIVNTMTFRLFQKKSGLALIISQGERGGCSSSLIVSLCCGNARFSLYNNYI